MTPSAAPAPKAHLVVVDDDDLLRPVLAGNLTNAGYAVREFAEPAAAVAAFATQPPTADLLILDWKLPGMSGLDLLRLLRDGGVAAPALFFTSHNETIYEEAALSFGAVDFVDKTRSFAILLRRIEMILERPRPAVPGLTEKPLSIGPLRLDFATHGATWRDRPVELTFGEFRVVALLARAQRDVEYREIYDVLRGENFLAGDGPDGYRANVRAIIKRIRQKFLAADGSFAAIGTYPGFGYRWTDAAQG